ncbi:hypothetical protein BDR26DRAFT_866218 [Obelidium mucronatum]|nr:hypothetical protein BDR26DRAFT_866218 [Obelidium mucronatum]
MSCSHTTNEPPSLLRLCIAKVNRRFDQVYSLNTSLGDVPSHLLKQILPKALNYGQLERLIEYNPHMQDELVDDLDPYYRTATLREFALLRKEVDKPDFIEPPSWRRYYAKMKRERDEKLLKVKASMNKSYKSMDEEKERNSTKRLQHFIAPPAKSKGWGSASSPGAKSNPMSRAINSVKKEIQGSRAPRFESYMARQIQSSSVESRSGTPRPPPAKVKPHPAIVQSNLAKGSSAPRNNATILPSAIMVQHPVAPKSFSLVLPK